MGILVSKLLHAGGNAILHSKVRLALLDALGTDALRMEIDVDQGSVSLKGQVRAPGSRELAGEVARKVGGVKSVTEDLRVVTEGSDDAEPLDRAGKVADRKLEAKVQLKLLEEIGAPALTVGIDAADGVVTLSGRPGDRDLLARAEETAMSVGGVSLWVIHEAGAWNW